MSGLSLVSLLFHTVLTLALGTAFTAALVYLARVTNPSAMLLPTLALFFFEGTIPDMVNLLFSTMLGFGLVRPDFYTLNVYHMLLGAVLALLTFFAVPELEADTARLAPLKQQLSMPLKAGIFLPVMYFDVQLFAALGAKTTLSIQTANASVSLISPAVGFAISGLLLAVLYFVYYRFPVSPRRVVIAGLLLLAVGYVGTLG